MGQEKIILDFGKNKKVEVEAKPVGMFSYGLMFRTRRTKKLIFRFGREINFKITGLFVFFPFVAVWLDKTGRVIEARRIKPFTFSALPARPFKTLVEIPIHEENKKVLDEIERFK